MSWLALVRLVAGLPPARCSASDDTLWVEMPDGVRLATRVFRPRDGRRAPGVLLRTPYGAHSRARPLFLLARLLAEAGFAAVIQDVRGRYASEGRFEPFAREGADGARAVHWLAEQPWCDGRIGLVGFSYLAYAAWAARAAAPEPVRALALGIGASDLHATFYPGGAFSLDTALRWSAAVGEREDLPERRLDLARALAFRPLREADRVAVRERPWYREWLDHPRADAYWEALRPPLAGAPPALFVAGWYDVFLGPQLADRAELAAGGGEARLVVGPWTHGRYARLRRSPRSRWFAHVAMREILAFLERHLHGEGPTPPHAVRLHPLDDADGAGSGWLELPDWPASHAEPRVLHLRGAGRANGLAGDGRLTPELPGAGEAPDRFTYDPADPVPSAGGALLGPGGVLDQRAVEARDDVLCYTSAPCESDFLLAGPVRVALFAASNAPDTDFTAKLVRVAADGSAHNLCEGISRCRWREGGLEPVWLEREAPVRLEIDLWATCARVRRGERLRLAISSSSFPRFDRNPNTRDDPARAASGAPARQLVLHDAAHPSHVAFAALPG